jgi:hypothetical protein
MYHLNFKLQTLSYISCDTLFSFWSQKIVQYTIWKVITILAAEIVRAFNNPSQKIFKTARCLWKYNRPQDIDIAARPTDMAELLPK